MSADLNEDAFQAQSFDLETKEVDQKSEDEEEKNLFDQ